MKLLSISSWQRHLFRREALNWSAVGINASIERLFAIYRLPPAVASALDPAGRWVSVSGAGGEYKFQENQHSIEQLAIDPVSVQFQITGDTDIANAFYEDLLESIEKAAQTKIDRAEELTMTLQTIVVAKMDIDPWRFYSSEWKDFLNAKLAPLVGHSGATQRFWPQTFTTAVTYNTEGGDYIITPKPFTIEPRVGTTPEQGIFYVQSPTDSKTHIQLMDELERIFHK